MKNLKHLVAAIALSFVALFANAATIHIPDATLASKLASIATNTIKCVLIDITSYARATDTTLANLTQVTGTGYTAGGQTLTSVTVTADTTNHKTVITYTPAAWSGATTISATGAAIIDTTDGDKILAVADFGGTVASSGGAFTITTPIVVEFTHF